MRCIASGTFTGDALDPGITLLIRNKGISLYNPRLVLWFRGENGLSSMSVPLHRRDERTGQIDEFARGMVAEFGIKLSELDRTGQTVLSLLVDPGQQDASYVVTSQGYSAKRIRIGGRRACMTIKWNRFVYRFNHLFDKQIGEHGLKQAEILPELVDLTTPVRFLVHENRNRLCGARV